jgi:hypothetical protein
MNERGSVTIDSEIRDLLDITDGDLVRLSEIKVVKVEDEGIDVKQLPDETCSTISRINDRGVVRIDKEVREVLGIDDKKVKLKISGIEVAKIVNESTKTRSAISLVAVASWYATVAASWSRAKSVFMKAHPEIKYPPNRSTATMIIGSWALIAAVATILLSQNGAIERLAAGDPVEWAGLITALAFGAIVMILLLPDRKETVRKLANMPSE